MRTQLVLASTGFGLATVCAALESGLLGDADRRLLVVSSNVALPEGAPRLLDDEGAARLATRFDAVLDHNATLDPLHPAGWSPRNSELPLWERHLRTAWSLGDDDVELVVESPAVDPARALARVFAEADVMVYADGLMTYGPTRTAVDDQVGCRVRKVLHLDLVAGLAPLLLSEWEVPARVIAADEFRKVVATLPTPPAAAAPTTLVLGQYLAAGGLLSPAEEVGLYADMVRRCTEAGHRRIVFKAHPSAPPAYRDALVDVAREVRADLAYVAGGGLAESWFAAGGIDLVVGCFSTALLTAREIWGLPAAQLGAETMLQRLTPYENSNRIPALLVDATVPDLRTWTRTPGGDARPPVDVSALVGAVGYAMQPRVLARRRADAVAFLGAHPDLRTRYVRRRRLTALGLPGGRPKASWPRAAARKVWTQTEAAIRRTTSRSVAAEQPKFSRT